MRQCCAHFHPRPEISPYTAPPRAAVALSSDGFYHAGSERSWLYDAIQRSLWCLQTPSCSFRAGKRHVHFRSMLDTAFYCAGSGAAPKAEDKVGPDVLSSFVSFHFQRCRQENRPRRSKASHDELVKHITTVCPHRPRSRPYHGIHGFRRVLTSI